MIGSVNVFANITWLSLMSDRNWFMHPPHDRWYRSIVDLVSFLEKHETSLEKLKAAIRKHPPKNGWDADSTQFVRLVLKLATKNS